MAFSIESRVPFLTPALATFLLSLPDEYLVAVDGTSKAVFRRAMRGIVPGKILDRRDKVGFPTPERDWLLAQQSFVQQVLTGATARRIGALNLNVLLPDWENQHVCSMARISGRQKSWHQSDVGWAGSGRSARGGILRIVLRCSVG